MPTCPDCSSDYVDQKNVLPNQQQQYGCNDCDHVWVTGVAQPVEGAKQSYATAKAHFPTAGDVSPARREHADALKQQFLQERPTAQAYVGPFWAEYQQLFSATGLASAAPEKLHYFANSTTGASPGNMSVFNLEWNRIGPEEGAARVREAIHHLLHGDPTRPQEDRLSDLLAPGTALGMTGWKESLLTKVLCVVEPDRWLPILTYSSVNGGKKEIAEAVFGLHLPPVSQVTWPKGRLIAWSNDLLRDLCGDGFPTLQHASQFLWWAKDQQPAAAA